MQSLIKQREARTVGLNVIHTKASQRQVSAGRDAVHYEALQRAATYIEDELRSQGYRPERQSFSVAGREFGNIEAEQRGTKDPKSIVIVGAHYDTADGLPGANDNGSGIAAGLELARKSARQNHRNSIRWVFFANEEPPYFQTPAMGSYVYAKRCRERGERGRCCRRRAIRSCFMEGCI
jgi:acetylornithine deacetylase/succinyl-diaminopimelate desuccinylase-like protein